MGLLDMRETTIAPAEEPAEARTITPGVLGRISLVRKQVSETAGEEVIETIPTPNDDTQRNTDVIL